MFKRIWIGALVLILIFAMACSVLDPDPTTDPTTEPTVGPTTGSTGNPPPTTDTGGNGGKPIDIGAPVKLTTNPGNDLDPAWDPRGGVITFMQSKPGAPDRPYDIGAIAPDGSDERVMAIGPTRDIGVAGELAWVGKSGVVITNERISIHEYMTFNTLQAPFNRSASNGADAAFVPILQIPGGMGGDGITVSRDGAKVLWKVRTNHNPASWVITVHIAGLSELSGQPATEYGTVLMRHSAAESGADFERGFALTPDGKNYVISLKNGEGYDLSLRDSTTGDEIRRLTSTGGTNGVFNTYPDISPDGEWVSFTVQGNADAKSDLFVMETKGGGVATQVTDTPNMSEQRPSWSPDGLDLAYQANDYSQTETNWDIYKIGVFSE